MTTSCQANVPRSDMPKPQFDLVKDTFWDYFAEATQTAQETLKTIRESELGEQVNTKIQNAFKAVSQYATIVQDQVSAIGQVLYYKASEKLDWLSEHLQPQIKEVRERVKPYSEDLRAQLKQLIERLRQEVASNTESWRTHPLKLTLIQMFKQMERTLVRSLRELENLLGPSTVELKDKITRRLEGYLKSVTTLALSPLEEILHQANMLEEMVEPYIHDLRKRLDPYTQGIKYQLRALWDSFRKIV